jgi:hypothetical protein
VAAAGGEYYLLALRADPDQFIAPPDAQADPPPARPVPEQNPQGILGFGPSCFLFFFVFFTSFPQRWFIHHLNPSKSSREASY